MSRILCFTWNTDRTPLCETYLEGKATTPIYRAGGLFSKSGTCFNPLFFDAIEEQLRKYTPVLAVFVTENDPVEGTHFHSNFLPDEMKNISQTLSYTLLSRDKYVDDDNTNVLRMSIYVKAGSQNIKSVELSKGLIFNDNKLGCAGTYLGSPKIIALYVETNFGRFAFIGIQVPRGFGDRSICLASLESKFVTNKNLDSVFLLGDFANDYIVDSQELLKYDEIDNLRISSIVPGYTEDLAQYKGVQNNGPQPNGPPAQTAPLTNNRSFLVPTFSSAYTDKYVNTVDKVGGNNINDFNTYLDLTKADTGKVEIGYHDRIFHKTIRGFQVQALEYLAIEASPMLSHTDPNVQREMNHLGIVGVYQLAGQNY